MIRIKELFRLQNLKHLRLIAGQEGLERTVTAAVLLEYDPSRMQLPDFYRGDLVVTTLAYARGDSQLVANSLLALMNQGIAGLLVKTAYFSELPQSVVSLANKLGTPLFLFDETYIEEVILEVTELIRGKRHFVGYEQELDALMRGGLTAEQTKEKLQRIDPAGAKAYRVCALYPQERMAALEEKMYALLNADEALAQAYICMEWRRMLIVLVHEEEEQADGRAEIRSLLERAGVSLEGMRIGVSECKTEQEAFSTALNEAVYGARAAKLTKKEIVCAKELGLYAYLFPMSENAFVCSQCRSQMKRIRDYDAQNRTNLEQTARVYVAESMEIAATAKALFQHPNTVRYRLTKIQKLMELEDDALFAPMLSLMINLSRILEEEGRA
ncbi:MAG: PucR family transcriptional regulator ligand-binding domain-containing protein [Clostridia bacterium]|nr:PucR family transcriptional regulator ligand-binding domain-containing protein [Clostridia bacterium]